MRVRGNAWCSKIWLARWDPVNQPVDLKDDDRVKDFMVAKYEKRRFYSESAEKAARSSPSISSLSSNSSQDNKPISSLLIGSTIKAHMASTQAAHVSTPPSSVIPRSAVPRPQDKSSQPSRPAQPPPSTFQQPSATSTAAQSTPSAIPAFGGNNMTQNSQNSSEAFADFANFDTAAFDSLPSDPLSAAPAFPTDTLPPIKKLSQGSYGGIQSANPTVQAQNSINKPLNTQSAQDRYSALKELDDLFKSANIQSPADNLAGNPTIQQQQQQPQPPQVMDNIFGGGIQSNGGADLFADLTKGVTPSNTITTSDTQQQFGRLSPAPNWAAGGNSSVTSAAAPWATSSAWNTSTSPNSSRTANNLPTVSGNNSSWANSSSPAAAGTSLWSADSGSNIAPSTGAGTMWTATNGSAPTATAASSNNWAWNQQPSVSSLQPPEAAAIGSSHNQDIWAAAGAGSNSTGNMSTNPFGTSPSSTGSGGLAGPNFSENNNDLFAAAPKPFNDKSGNPWSNVPAFTQNMTPAPNPNNPFL